MNRYDIARGEVKVEEEKKSSPQPKRRTKTIKEDYDVERLRENVPEDIVGDFFSILRGGSGDTLGSAVQNNNERLRSRGARSRFFMIQGPSGARIFIRPNQVVTTSEVLEIRGLSSGQIQTLMSPE